MRSVTLALVLGLALLGAALGLTLARSPMVVAASDGVPATAQTLIAATSEGARYCQSHELLPQGTAAVRVSLVAPLGPRVDVVVSSRGHAVTSGETGPGWTGETVTVPLRPLPRAVAPTTVCVSFRLPDERLYLLGQTTSAVLAARGGLGALPGRMRLEYMRPGPRSWASLIPSVIRRMSFGRATSGTWIVFLALALAAAVAILTVRLVRTELAAGAGACARVLRAGRRPALLARVPRAAAICALIACLNAACWSIVTYAFQVPDEPDHFAYVERLAEFRTPPTAETAQLPVQEEAALIGLHAREVRAQLQNHTIDSRAEQQALQRDLAAASKIHQAADYGAGVANSEPPLYYAIEAVPYALAASGGVLARLQLMRLTSAMMAGLTALFVFMFIREALPGGPPWSWVVGGLGVALVPLLGFMSGGVNPDSQLAAVSAALFYCLARAFRRGLSTHMAAALGALTAIGFMTKLNFIGLAPGILAGLVVLSVRAARVQGRSAYRMLALALALALSPCVVYVGVNALSGRPLLGIVSAAARTVHGSVLAEASYIWQVYLPHLPGTVDYFSGLQMAREVWFRGYVGLYGWLDTTFPNRVYSFALVPALALALLLGRALLQARAGIRRRAPELATYASLCAGLLVLIGADSYHQFPLLDAAYAQVRYLLPMLALLGAALALAARAAGRRWGPALGTLIVLLFLAHDIFSQLLVAGRYYG
jgi:hypothetical protein